MKNTDITIEINPENQDKGLIIRHEPALTPEAREAMWERIDDAIEARFPDNRSKGGVMQDNGITFVTLRFDID